MSGQGWASLFLLNSRILVVDDDEDFARASADLLRAGGAQVQAAFDGNAAAMAIRSFDPDLIVCDLAMPQLRGDALLAQLRKGGYEKPFILMTGFADLANVAEAMHLHAFDYLVKPIDPKVFVAAVQRALRSEHERLVREEAQKLMYEALAALPPPEGAESWPEAIKARAIRTVRERRTASTG